jgi:DNA-binding transcriptional ArsR family regulator
MPIRSASSKPSIKASKPSAKAQEAMLQFISGFWVSRLIEAVARLGICDLIRSGPATAEDLALATDTHAPSLYRALRALASAGILTEDAQGRFGRTPLSATLETETPGSLRWFAMAELGQEHYVAWEKLTHSLKTGETAFEAQYEMTPWDYYATHPEDGAVFDQAMTNATEMVNAAILQAYSFSKCKVLADIGGGQGSFLSAILHANPKASGILYDRPSVVEGGARRIVAEGLAGRCEIVAGDFFASAPKGADAYLLKWIIHDWEDSLALKILKQCRAAMPPQGRVLLFECVLPEGGEPHLGKLIDINMLVMTGGRERTGAEYRELLSKAKLKVKRIVPTASPVSVIEAVRA